MKVSVIIAYNNDRGFLKYAIDSVHSQTYKDYELILSQSDNRVGFNINRGVEKATGQLIKMLSDDDLLPANALSDLVGAMGDNDFIHGNSINFRGDFKSTHIAVNQYPTFRDILRRNFIHGGTTMYRKDLFERFGGYDESLWTGEELDFHLKVLQGDAKIGYCDSFVYQYRLHDKQKSIGKSTRAYKNRRKDAIHEIRNRYR